MIESMALGAHQEVLCFAAAGKREARYTRALRIANKPRLRYDWKTGLWVAPDALYGTRRHASAQADALSRSLRSI